VNQRVGVALSAVALVGVVAGGAALAARSSGGSHTPKTIAIQGVGASATTAAASANGAFLVRNPNVTFVLSGDLPLLDGDRPAWHLPANPTDDLGRIATLAKALGVDGEVTAVEGGWQVRNRTSGHSFYVGNAPGLPWNYVNAPDAYTCPAVTTVPLDAGVGTTLPLCAGPPPPVGVPTKDEALAKAGEFFKVLGIDANSFSITANASEFSAEVLVTPTLDGITAPGLMSSFSFAGEGKLQFANGFLFSPEKADSYPRIGTLKAFELLKSGSGAMGGFIATASGGGVATAVATTVVGGESTTTTACVVMGSVPNSASVSLPCPVATTLTSTPEGSFATVVGANCMGYDPATGAPPPDTAGAPATTVPCGWNPCDLPPTTTVAVDQPMSPSALTCFSNSCGYVPVTTIPVSNPAEATTAPPSATTSRY
jgi:hypothetical protein